MLAILNVALPIFALIFIGYFCRIRGILGENASSELSRFVVYLALPSLLFNATYHLKLSDFDNPHFMLVFAIGIACVFTFTLVVRLKQKVGFADATIEALGAGYANTGFIGIPLCMLAFGQEGVAPAVISTVMTACLLFAISIVMVEVGMYADAHLGITLIKVTRSLSRNPLIVAPCVGFLMSLYNIPLANGIGQIFKLLGDAAGPCALVSLGLFLAQSVKKDGSSTTHSPVMVVVLKLIVQPLVTAVLAYKVFSMPLIWADTALLLSALPIGTGPFMLAEMYDREAVVVSRAILVSTVGSLLTVSMILVWMHYR